MPGQAEESADLSAREFNERVADPARFSGGGSVAALTAAGSAAAALLVARLSRRRKSNAAAATSLDAAIASMEGLIERFYQVADNDLLALDQLLMAQRAVKTGAERPIYIAALTRAAESPVALARDCLDLLRAIDALLPLASRFTVSDLGAAAALAAGAGQAALLTALVNVALLRDESLADAAAVQSLDSRIAKLRDDLIDASDSIQARVTDAIVASPSRHA